MGQEILRTDRLLLRRVRADDVDNFVGLNGHPDVMRYLAWLPPSRPEVEDEVARILDGYVVHPEHGTFAADDTAGAFVGWFALTVTDAGAAAPDLGYRLCRDRWGNGLATEGAGALVDRAFAALGAERVTADTMHVNRASRRVLEKCGLRHVRTIHPHYDEPLPGTEFGDVVYEITRREWASLRAG